MRITIQREVEICDICKIAEAPSSKCLECGTAICYDCRKTNGVEFRHSLNCSGTGDGIYCSACYAAKETAPDPLFLAYKAIASMTAEAEASYKAMKHRADIAESQIKTLRAQRGLR